MYKLKPFVSEFKDARQFDGHEESYQAIAEWLKSEGKETDGSLNFLKPLMLSLNDEGEWDAIEAGDYFVMTTNKDFYPVSGYLFETLFDEVVEE